MKSQETNLPSNFLNTIVTFHQLHPATGLCFAKTYFRIGNLCLQIYKCACILHNNIHRTSTFHASWEPFNVK